MNRLPRYLFTLLFLLSYGSAWTASLLTLDAGQDSLPATLRHAKPGSLFRIEQLDVSLPPMELQRIQVFTDDAVVIVHREDGEVRLPKSDRAYYRGRLEGRPQSRVVLSAGRDGIRGLISEAENTWLLGQGSAARSSTEQLRAVKVDLSEVDKGFHCATDQLSEISGSLPDASDTLSTLQDLAASAGTTNYSANIAIETDFEYLQLFGGNTTAAMDYAADLVAYTSSIYSAEVNTELRIGHMSLWETSADPWTANSTDCLLGQMGNYWGINNTGISRTIAHFLSGRSNNSGIAWIGVLCHSNFLSDFTGCGLPANIGSYGGAYGVTSGLDGNFDVNSPATIWDILAVSHEIGHNFDSPHTHCYAGIGGNPAPIDQCYAAQSGASCYSGATSLPCAQSGAGCGTIMSYCHLLSGGMSNVSMTLGAAHPFGVEPGRVPSRMATHVTNMATTYPSCLTPVPALDRIFQDNFDSGDTSAWDATVP